MREDSQEDKAMQAALVLAQQGTPDTRTLQDLQPLITVQQLHEQLWISTSGQKAFTTAGLNSSQAGHGKANAKSRGASARSVASTAASAAARPGTCVSQRLEVPEHVDPVLWAAALQQQANTDGQQQDSQLSKLWALQEKMLQQVESYKQVQPQLQKHQPNHPYLRVLRQIARGSAEFQEAAAAGAPVPPSSTRSASTVSTAANPLALSRANFLAGRLEAACQQIIEGLPVEVASAATTAMPTSTHRTQLHSRLQQQSTGRSAVSRQPAPSRIGARSKAGAQSRTGALSSRNHQQQQQQQQQPLTSKPETARTPVLLNSKPPPNVAMDAVPSSSVPQASSSPCKSGPGQHVEDSAPTAQPSSSSTAAADVTPNCPLEDSRSSGIACQWLSAEFSAKTCTSRADSTPRQVWLDSAAAKQSSQWQPTGGISNGRADRSSRSQAHMQQQQHPPPELLKLDLHQLKQHRIPGSNTVSSRAWRAARTGSTPSSKRQQSNAEGIKLAVSVQAKMSPAAAEAFRAAVATSADKHLQHYRTYMQQAQQQLLARELGHADSGAGGPRLGGQTASAAAANAAIDLGNTASSSSTQMHSGPASGVAGTTDAAAASDAAEKERAGARRAAASSAGPQMTVQQMVAMLSKHDAQPETQPSHEQPSESETNNFTAAANQKFTAASSLSELIEAADEHLRVASQEFGIKLDIGRIARLQKIGKAWRGSSEANSKQPTSRSAASSGDGNDGSGNVTETAASTARSDASSGSSSRPRALAAREARPVRPPKPIPPGSFLSTNTSSAAVAPRVRFSTDTASATEQQTTTQMSEQPQSQTSSTAGPAAAAGGVDNPRRPAAMRMPPPKLQDPSTAELLAIPMPSLPHLLDLSHEPVKLLQARLERVWAALGMPPADQMDMVLRYTSYRAASDFEAMLGLWEIAAAAVLQREAILEQLMQLRAAMQHDSQHCQQQHGPGEAPNDTSQPPLPPLLGLTIQQVQQLLWAFLAATHQVHQASAGLAEVVGQPLLVDRSPYPPPGPKGVLSASDLQPILDEAWKLLGGNSNS